MAKANGKAPQKKFRIRTLSADQWDRRKLNRLLGKIEKKKILVLGDIGVDRYTVGAVERISPEAPVPIVRVQQENLKLGLAANVADNLRVLGGVPLLVGILGKDHAAEDFKRVLKAAKISSSHLIEDSDRCTIVKERIVSDRQQLLRVDYENSVEISEPIEKAIRQKIEKIMPEVDAVIIEDYAKGLIQERLCQNVVRLASQLNKMVAVDPNSKTPLSFYKGVSILTPNTKEAEYLSGISITNSQSLCAAGMKIVQETDCQFLVITRGRDGMALFRKGRAEVCLIPTYAREVYDVSGAGDTVIAVLVLALVAGGELEEAAILGNLAAGVEVGKRGTATVSQEEIRQFLQEVSRKI
ncbi:MAG: D-glycero-beta-D-manno-heptose-7-phosphate kinase [Bdellovibrio sp.]|nr:D-glycero-beta-D-manno-heptose-7-phosphate kinase [Bdellovibrio sp.]